MANDSSSSIMKNTGLITLCTLGSRVTGLLRTWAMAFALGNTLLTSAYQIAYNLPAMIYELAASGLLATAFLPLYLLSKEKGGEKDAHKFSSNMLSIVLVFLGLLTLACSVFAPLVIETQTFTIGNGEEKDLAIFFFRVFSIQILLYGVGAVITGILNAERNYLLPALAPVVNNIVVIITMFGYVFFASVNASFAMWWLAIGTSLGVVFQFGAQIPALIKQGFKYTPHINLKDPMLKEAIKVAIPMFVYIAGTMITFSCRNAFSLDATPNGPSTLNYAWMWYQLPYGVIAVSLSTTLFTELSDCAAREDWKGFKHFIQSGLSSTFFLIIPLAAMVGALAIPLMQLFQAGAFKGDDAIFVGEVLFVWIFSLPFYAGYMYMYRVFAALRSFLQFAIIDFALRIPQVILYYLFCSNPEIGLIGIPLADLIFYGIMFIVCNVLVSKRVGNFGIKSVIETAIKTTCSSAVAMAVVYFGATALNTTLNLSGGFVGIAGSLAIVCVFGCLGLAISFGLCKILKVQEFSVLSSIANKFLGKLKRS